MFGTVAAENTLADKPRHLVDRDFDAGVDDLGNGTGDHGAFLELLKLLADGVLGQLLNAETDAFFVHVHIQHFGLDHIALLIIGERLFAGFVPTQVGKMGHAVDFTVQPDKQTEFGNIFDFALNLGADREFGLEAFPRIGLALLEAQRDAAFFGIRVEHHNLDFLAGGDDLSGMHVLFGPAHFRNMNQPFDTRLQLHEGAVIGNVGDPAGKLGFGRILGFHAFPGVCFQLFQAERDALGFGVEADHLNIHGLADLQHFRRVIDAAPGDVGDVKQAIDAAQIDKGAVIGDVLDHALEDLSFGEVGNQFGTGFGTGFLKHRTPGDNDVVALRVHFQNLERLRRVHERRDITHRADIHLGSGQERHGAGKIDDKTALDAAENNAVDALGRLEGFFQIGPRFLAPGLFTAEPDNAVAVFVAFDKNIDGVTVFDVDFLADVAEFLQRHPAFGFEADVDQHIVIFDGNDRSLDDTAFEAAVLS